MKIGLLSDTHGDLDPKVFEYFDQCDEIWHAGDIGDRAVTDALRAFKPLRAVHGNIDSKELCIQYPEDLKFKCEGLNIFITHIGGKPPSYNPRVKKLLTQSPPDIFVCGHSHLLLIKRDVLFANMLFINPGAAGNHGFHKIKTLVRFDVNQRLISNMEVIETGKRGTITGNRAEGMP
ncbi:metallophosphoesterase family protein [Chryseolinea sp. T2]|uniref:metallophosphoesterase family protein n=1 Tax=Chryseolinea sp. T2 TaxID=3129255 RepID=UPI00307689B3